MSRRTQLLAAGALLVVVAGLSSTERTGGDVDRSRSACCPLVNGLQQLGAKLGTNGAFFLTQTNGAPRTDRP